jgi:hypothetical protein
MPRLLANPKMPGFRETKTSREQTPPGPMVRTTARTVAYEDTVFICGESRHYKNQRFALAKHHPPLTGQESLTNFPFLPPLP